MQGSSPHLGAYKRVDIETTSQGKLIVMLFNGAIQRAEEAKRQLQRNNTQGVHSNLIRAQDIVTELRNALDMKAGELARNLDRIYEYFQHLLIKGNVKKEAAPIEEAIGHLTVMRDTWREAFEAAAREKPGRVGQIDTLGAKVMNIQG
ncbi:MAG: flagellar export chaperone FliS [Candidatus Hydrogenedentes bacterium]|nr:flagellar export chaperone FliS [Candidatus Hydrogenedentota bacterium]